MPYVNPKQWVHGETLNATELTKYATALDFLHTVLGDVRQYRGAASTAPGEDDDHHFFVHRFRWLWFEGAGELVDPQEEANTFSLTEDGEPTLIDLGAVSWLYPGKLYSVTGCTWCMETQKP